MIIHHKPVLGEFLVKDVVRSTDTLIVDATLGEGGHSLLFLERGLRVHALERDERILGVARERLAAHADRFTPHRVNFAHAQPIFERLQGTVDLALFDLGISMYHYRAGGRGFSFLTDEPLDMRTEPEAGNLGAGDVVNGWPEARLADLFYELGEEKKSRAAARAIVSERAKAPILTSRRLAEVVKDALGPAGKTHPATRVFQALRIHVNSELANIVPGLEAASKALAPGGRLAVLTYHSLEDRLVKELFRSWAGPKIHVNRYREEPGPKSPWRLPSGKPVTADRTEVAANPAARSAKLRIIERAE